jgi:thiol-disulfide isomerase/thioredoxin
VTVVDFFASWCQPCKEGLSEILTVRQKLGPRFELMIVAVEGDTLALRDFLASQPLPAETTVALDRNGALARAFGEDRLPTTFFLDDKAIIRHINRGHGFGYRARAARWLTEMLATGP